MESFIVRVWVPGEGDGQADGRLRGKLVRLASGETHTFRDPDELVALLGLELQHPRVLPEPEGSR